MISENFLKFKLHSKQSQLVAVTKGRSVSEITEVIKAGAEIIGENRVQEAKEKFAKIEVQQDLHTQWQKVEKHLIGHLQTNKVKDAIKLFDVIQSVDSLRLAEAINEATQTEQRIFLQVNISEDEDKFGIAPDELFDVYEKIAKLPNLKVEGLMTITKKHDDPTAARKDFQKMKMLFDEFCEFTIERLGPRTNPLILSMGMSSDYEMAVEEGSTMVRVGTAIFGPRL